MTPSSQLSESQIQERREALAAAERSRMMEGLPPVSQLAKDLVERWAKGEMTMDEVIAALNCHYAPTSQDPEDSK